MFRAAKTVFTIAFALSTAAAAEPTATISGIVVDAATQSPVAGAQITAHSPALTGEQSATTDGAGAFEMTLLPAGSYGLTVRRDGFQPFSPEGLVVRDHASLRVRLRIQAAAPAAVPEFSQAMTPPVRVSGPDPEYTQAAIDHGVEGLMVVKCLVTTEGAVRECHALKSLPFMEHPVVSALEHRRYRPAMLQGKPVEVQYTFNVRLSLPQ